MSTQKSKNFGRFLRQNLVLIIIIACILAITGIILGVSLNKGPDLPVGPSTGSNYPVPEFPDYLVTESAPKNEQPTFMAPVVGYTQGMGYSRDAEYVMVYKKTLNEWSVHNGIDFLADAGTAVVAISDGTVVSVRNEYGMGNIVEIRHADGLVSIYCSLGDDVSVSVNDVVKAGDRIGVVSTSAAYEYKEGAHLHLETKLNGKYVNPGDYFTV